MGDNHQLGQALIAFASIQKAHSSFMAIILCQCRGQLEFEGSSKAYPGRCPLLDLQAEASRPEQAAALYFLFQVGFCFLSFLSVWQLKVIAASNFCKMIPSPSGVVAHLYRAKS